LFFRSQVRLGEFDLSKTEDCNGEECYQPAIDLEVEKIIPHEDYSNQTFQNDIALLRLSSSSSKLGLSTVSPICLPLKVSGYNISHGPELEAAGWGLTGWRKYLLLLRGLVVRAATTLVVSSIPVTTHH